MLHLFRKWRIITMRGGNGRFPVIFTQKHLKLKQNRKAVPSRTDFLLLKAFSL